VRRRRLGLGGRWRRLLFSVDGLAWLRGDWRGATRDAGGGGVARGGDVGVWPLDTVAVASCENWTAGRGAGAERKASRATAGEAIERIFYVPSLFSFSFFLGVEIRLARKLRFKLCDL
jgi:hypothetical protein